MCQFNLLDMDDDTLPVSGPALVLTDFLVFSPDFPGVSDAVSAEDVPHVAEESELDTFEVSILGCSCVCMRAQS